MLSYHTTHLNLNLTHSLLTFAVMTEHYFLYRDLNILDRSFSPNWKQVANHIGGWGWGGRLAADTKTIVLRQQADPEFEHSIDYVTNYFNHSLGSTKIMIAETKSRISKSSITTTV